ncbi:AAA family ATPase [Eggerthellaceae bacterium zg-893]|nr:AAA family ATPase [Eggerthellaceae bacterium zg-893]
MRRRRRRMRNTTDSAIRPAAEGRRCEHCGRALAKRRVPSPFDPAALIPFGYEECRCEGARAERLARERAGREEERRREEAARARAFERAGIPKRYRDAAHPYAEKMARMAEEGQGFFIHGPNGTFKTTLAMAAARLLMDAGVDVLAVASYDLMDAMRSRKDEDRRLFERASGCKVLVLDDLGKEASNTPYACERLFAIVDKRDKEMLPVIVTSNCKLSEIAVNIAEGAVGVAIASRLAASCKQVRLDGPDRRIHGQD